MALAQHFIYEEGVVKSVSGEVVLDLWLEKIERVFHLLRVEQFIRISYEEVERWYKEHQKEVMEIIQSSYMIEKTPLGRITRKVDTTRGYMKDDIGYSIILLSRVMGLLVASHLAPFMVNFIDTIRHAKMPLDWATTLSENLCD